MDWAVLSRPEPDPCAPGEPHSISLPRTSRAALKTAAEVPPSPRRRWLRWWLVAVALLRVFSAVTAVLRPEVLRETVFAARPAELTPLAARLFAAWTTTTAVLCLLCARGGADPRTPIYAATLLSFVVALGLFVPELAYHGTMTVMSSLSPGIVATTSVTWMMTVWRQESKQD
ncbi:hypothetical protein AB1Y20_022076 [Prymnesium parvum]|uniref:Uncharacterized protein n=1 Tax=Prymnesium parvum TaxID=97485 RepID=A0AB34JGV7_PRYPA